MAQDSVKIKITADNTDYKKKISEIEPLAKKAGTGISNGLSKGSEATSKFAGLLNTAKVACGNLVAEGIMKVSNAITGSLGSAVARVDTLQNYVKIMANLGAQSNDVAQAQDNMRKAIENLPTSTQYIYSMQQQFYALSQNMQEATEITIALNNATLAGGQGMEKASGAMQQWFQMISAGKPDLMSMRIINEAMPAQLDAISKSLMGNEANWHTLYKAWQEGKVTSKDVEKAIIDLNENGLKTGGREIASFAQQAEDATGGIGTSFDVMKSRITSRMADIIMAIGTENITAPINAMTDLINKAGEGVVKVIEYVKEHWDTLAPVIEGITVLVGALAAGFTALGIALGISKIITSVTKAMTKLNATLAANPVILVVAAIAALAAGLVLAYKHCDAFREVVDKAFSKIKEVVTNAWEQIKATWDTVQPYVSAFWDAIKIVFSEALDFIKILFKIAWDAIKIVWSAVEPFFSALWEAIKAIFSVVKDVLGGFFEKAWEAIKKIWSAVSPWFNFLWQTIKAIFSVVEMVLSGDFSRAWDAIKKIWQYAKNFFSDVWEGIKAVFSSVVDFFKDAFTRALDKVKEVFSLENLKQIFHNSIIGGLEGVIEDAKTAAGKVFNAIKDAFSKAINITFGFGDGKGGGILGDMAGSSGALSPFNVARISSKFGVSRPGHKHAGVDLAAPTGTPIQSVVAGRVTRVQNLTTGYGKNVIVTDKNGNQFLYGHMSAINVRTGQPVLRGSRLGAVGSTGHSTGPHLHFEVRQGGRAVNPMSWYYNARRAYASGGFPQYGEMFIANEEGPEMIGKFGRENVVANNLQIIEGIRRGVFNGLIQATRAKSGSTNHNVTLTQVFNKEQQSPSDIKRAARKGIRQALAGGIG